MVIFGGLEIVAAGYVLHELGKDDDKARQTAENRRRRRHNSHSHRRRDSDSRPRPPRPSQQSLAPPTIPPPRPNSAPPQQQMFPPQGRPPPPGPAGPWMNGPPQHQHQQRPPQFPPQGPPAHTQSWPVQPRPPPQQPQLQRPNTQPQLGPNSPMFRPSDFPANPNNRPPFTQNQQPPPMQQHQQYSQSPPPPQPQYHAQQQQQHSPPGPEPIPGQLPHRPTMYFDTKTGKWQSGMLPREEAQSQSQRSGSAPPTADTRGSRARTGSNNFVAPPSRLREGQRAYSSGSYSESDSGLEDDLAYGSLPWRRGDRRRRRTSGGWRAAGVADVAKVHSYERERPMVGVGGAGPVELRAEEDWYARGREERVGYRAGSGGAGVGGGGGGDGRGRAGTMPAELDSRVRYELA